MKCWRKRNAVSPVRMGKFCCTSLRSLPPKGGLASDDVEAVLFLHVGEVLGERVGVDDVGRFDAVQDHVHDRDDVGEGLLFLPVEGALLQGAVLGGGALGVLGAEVIEGLAEEAGRADGGVADGLAELRAR